MSLVKILFAIEQDEDGYPPVAVESVWARRSETPNCYILDNIPFFVRVATIDDIVATSTRDECVWFETVVVPSNNSLLRAVLFDNKHVEPVRLELKRIGCSTEWDDSHRLIAISVPNSVKLETVESALSKLSSEGILDYEVPIIRQ